MRPIIISIEDSLPVSIMQLLEGQEKTAKEIVNHRSSEMTFAKKQVLLTFIRDKIADSNVSFEYTPFMLGKHISVNRRNIILKNTILELKYNNTEKPSNSEFRSSSPFQGNARIAADTNSTAMFKEDFDTCILYQLKHPRAQSAPPVHSSNQTDQSFIRPTAHPRSNSMNTNYQNEQRFIPVINTGFPSSLFSDDVKKTEGSGGSKPNSPTKCAFLDRH
jgi:hypothetical protein